MAGVFVSRLQSLLGSYTGRKAMGSVVLVPFSSSSSIPNLSLNGLYPCHALPPSLTSQRQKFIQAHLLLTPIHSFSRCFEH